MPNRWSWLALGLGAYLAFALVLLPAATAYRLLAPAAVQLFGLEGTVWSGRAAYAVVDRLAVQDLRWRLNGAQLFTGRLVADLEAHLTDGFVTTRVAATRDAVELTGLRLSTSLATLREVLPLQGFVGLMSAALARARFEQGWPTIVVGEVKIAGLAIDPKLLPGADTEPLLLGDYSITFADSAGNAIAAEFRDTGGPLAVDGKLSLDRQRRYTLDGLIAARPMAPPTLIEGLKIMTAEPDAEGRRRLELSGSL